MQVGLQQNKSLVDHWSFAVVLSHEDALWSHRSAFQKYINLLWAEALKKAPFWLDNDFSAKKDLRKK